MSTNINLLLHDKESLKLQKRVRILNFVAVMLLISVGISSLVLFLSIQTVNPSSIEKEKTDVLGKISQFQNRQVNLFILNNRISNIQEVLAKRKDLSKIMNTLLEKIPNGMSIEALEIDSKFITLSASSNSLSSIGLLINNLTDMVRKKEIINALTLSSLSFDEGKQAYQLSLKSEL